MNTLLASVMKALAETAGTDGWPVLNADPDINDYPLTDDGCDETNPFTEDEVRLLSNAALQAIEAAGYRVVPVEATREMRLAGEQEMMARHTNLDCFRDPYVDSTYAAMLSAAPRVAA